MQNKKIKKNIFISIIIATLLFLIFYLLTVFILEWIELKSIFDFILLYIVVVICLILIFFSIIYFLLAKDYFKDLKKSEEKLK